MTRPHQPGQAVFRAIPARRHRLEAVPRLSRLRPSKALRIMKPLSSSMSPTTSTGPSWARTPSQLFKENPIA